MKPQESISIEYAALEVDTSTSLRMEQIYQQIGKPLQDGSDRDRQRHYFAFLVDYLLGSIRRQIQERRIDPTASPDRLTVFAAPEFFFKDRHVGAEGGMPFDEPIVREGIERLQRGLAQIRGNLLVFAGSVWSWEEYEDARTHLPNVAIHNTTPVFYQGAVILEWNKKFLSTIDGLKDRGGPGKTWGPAAHWNRFIESGQLSASILYTDSPQPYTTIDVGGRLVKVGVEVCLEHIDKLRYLRKHGPADLDLHVLVCAGMSPNGPSIATRRGGAFLRCEGGMTPPAGRSSCGIVDPMHAVPMNEPSSVGDALQGRPMQPDERVRVYMPFRLAGRA